MITGEIKRFWRDEGMIKVSRSLKETAGKIRIVRDQLKAKNGREPTIEEISHEMQIAKEEIVLALESGAEVESLYKTIYQGDGNAIYLIDKIDQTEDESSNMINHMALQEVMNSWDEKEKNIIKLRYFKEKTQTEIAQQLGISQVQVSRLERKILKTMRERMLGWIFHI